ncbi:MAG: response regulator transcription factor [Phycisphaerales bacterium]|nr:response regulator transcription factor [Phycisphaerales bacterium]
MSKILVIDDMAIFRDPIAASLRMAGYETCCAADGREGLSMLKSQRPDLVLLDVAMPVMDGLTFLKSMRRESQVATTPVIILTAMADKKCVMEAAGLGVRDYLLKSRFSLKELLERVGKRLAGGEASTTTADASAAAKPRQVTGAKTGMTAVAATGAREAATGKATATAPAPAKRVAAAPQPGANEEPPELLSASECLNRVKHAMQGKTLSGAVAHVISLAGSPRADASQIAALIARDSTLSVRVLQAANSATYASKRGPVTTLSDAVRNIGCTTIRNIAATVGIFDAMPATGMDGFNPIRCWQHSFAVARLTEMLITNVDPEQAGTAYLAGLCHDLGDILIRTHFGPELQQVMDAQARTGRPRAELERQMLGMTRSDLATVVMTYIGLPDNIRGPVEAMHNPRATGPSAKIAQVLNHAEFYANGLLLASNIDSPVMPLLRSACRKAVGEETPAPPSIDEFRAEILCLAAMLARLTPADEAEVLKPLYAQRETSIWLAREKSFSEFDPLATALSLLAKTEVFDRLPTGEDLAGYHGVVVVAPDSNAPGFDASNIQKPLAMRAAGPVPVLWLTGERATAPKEGTLAPRPLALSLAELAAFVDSASQKPAA